MTCASPPGRRDGAATVTLPFEFPPVTSLPDNCPPAVRHSVERVDLRLRAAVYRACLEARLPRMVDHARLVVHFRPQSPGWGDLDTLAATAAVIGQSLAEGTQTTPGYGLCADERLAIDPSVLHPVVTGHRGRVWFDVEWRSA